MTRLFKTVKPKAIRLGAALPLAAAVLAVGMFLGQTAVPNSRVPGLGAGAVRGTSGAAAERPVISPSVPFSTEARTEITNLPAAPLTPHNAADLKAIQARVEAVMKYSLPATVGLNVPGGQGSGVIVSKDGYVLTAGHVSGTPGSRVTVVLSNGTMVRGQSLGANNGIDSGMVKILTPGEYPFVPLGTTMNLVAGQWVVALGHPGGYQVSRPPVVRLGRILTVRGGERGSVGTDCPLINGDSGGPLFDLDGRLIGINSRIGPATTINIHVPVDTFAGTWDRLAKGEQWGGVSNMFGRGGRGGPAPVEPATAVLGIRLDDQDKGVVISFVRPGTPAEGAGLKEGDFVTRLDGQLIKTADDVTTAIAHHKPGDIVKLDVLRSTETKEIAVKLGSED